MKGGQWAAFRTFWEKEMSMSCSSDEAKKREIAGLNDELRRTFGTGRIVMTAGFDALPGITWLKAIKAIREFSDFTPDNDPHGEHDFGRLVVDGYSLFWKIDYYDLGLTCHSPDPANPAVTNRVLTLMLAEEY
jgi:hypothetical protein